MTLNSLISQSRKHYHRFYRLVVFAVILMTAVLTGSLLLGDSVRGTLVQRVDERLGKYETIITSGSGFMRPLPPPSPVEREPEREQAANSKLSTLNTNSFLLMDGYVSVGKKLLPVYVWGTDSDSLLSNEVLINEPLRDRLNDQEDIVLHLPSRNQVPSGTLFVTKSYATQMRVHVVGVKSMEDGGNILLKNEQTLPLNIFINRKHLAEKMELEGKINIVLSKDIITEEQLNKCWTPELSGIHLTDTSLTCDGIFISESIKEKVENGRWKGESGKEKVDSGKDNFQLSIINSQLCQLYFSYFVNDIINGKDTIPYSFVTAVNKWHGESLDGQDIILSDYAAKRLHVSVNDSVDMSYFIAKDLKNLETNARRFKVKRIVPLSDFMGDSLLIANFPGLSNVVKCTDWDSDLPIKMERVHKIDEDYWYAYRQTPKAIVSYEAVQSDWSNAFGSATAIRFTSRPDIDLNPSDAGVQIYHPRAQGLKAATGGVDFAGLFLALGFFIILAAILLMKNPLVEMFTLRQSEIQLYQQLGFKNKTIIRHLFYEAFCVMLYASPLGVLAGLLYSGLTLWLLGNVWSGATHTEGFALHIQPLTLIIGWMVSLIICAIVLWMVLIKPPKAHQKAPHPPKGELFIYFFRARHKVSLQSKNSPSGEIEGGLSPLGGWGASLWLIVGLFLNFIYLHNMALFIVCGLLWILTWGLFLRRYVERKRWKAESEDLGGFTRTRLTWLSIHAYIKQHILAYWALSMGVFSVFSVGLNRPDFSQAKQQMGGYQLYVDSRVPIQYDLNNPDVRHKLSLQSLPDSTLFLSFLRHTQDEASCLNLNQVVTPTVLGVDIKDMEPFGLSSITQHPTPTTHIPQLYIDEEALMWSLKKSVGDTLLYHNDKGKEVPVLIAGTYPTGIFHGNAIMSKEDFRTLWPKEVGVEVLLVKSSHPEEAAEILSIAMNEYGLNIQTVEERIKMFFEVTETYLIIFMTLGGLGLLLGIFSLVIIVRKNLTAQATTIQQYRAMGFPEHLIKQMLLRENIIVPFYAILTGATGSIISISANVGGAGITALLSALAVLIIICLILYHSIKWIIQLTINN